MYEELHKLQTHLGIRAHDCVRSVTVLMLMRENLQIKLLI